MALALFADAPDVRRDDVGRWSLARERLPAAWPATSGAGRALDSLTWVVVDVETTGGSPFGGDRITEFCAVTVANGRIASVFETLQSVGAQVNATTWYDRTNYYAMLPSEHLPLVVEIEADRMRGALVTEADLASERVVVLNELDRGENDPMRRLLHAVYAVAFLAHPYGHPVIGWRSDVETVTAPGAGPIRVVLRRGADGDLFTQSIGTGRVDLTDPAVVALLDEAEARVRAAAGLRG